MTETQEFVIPSSPEDRKKILDAFKEISAAKARQAAEKDLINEALAKLAEDFSIPKKILRKLANTYHNDSMDKVKHEADQLETAWEIIVKGNQVNGKYDPNLDPERGYTPSPPHHV